MAPILSLDVVVEGKGGEIGRATILGQRTRKNPGKMTPQNPEFEKQEGAKWAMSQVMSFLPSPATSPSDPQSQSSSSKTPPGGSAAAHGKHFGGGMPVEVSPDRKRRQVRFGGTNIALVFTPICVYLWI